MSLFNSIFKLKYKFRKIIYKKGNKIKKKKLNLKDEEQERKGKNFDNLAQIWFVILQIVLFLFILFSLYLNSIACVYNYTYYAEYSPVYAVIATEIYILIMFNYWSATIDYWFRRDRRRFEVYLNAVYRILAIFL